MEMLVMGLVALAAFAAVLFPLFRRRAGYGDELEYENVPPADAAPPVPAVLDETGASEGDPGDPIEAEVLRYRAALRAGTLCRKCGQANPAASAFCFECGARLPLADAKEFE
jgi:hypothetical protein